MDTIPFNIIAQLWSYLSFVLQIAKKKQMLSSRMNEIGHYSKAQTTKKKKKEKEKKVYCITY